MTAPPLHLPRGLNLIADVAGDAAAIALARAYGGGRFYVPEVAAGSLLESLVGSDAAMALARAYGGNTLEIPVARRSLAYWLFAQGRSVSDVQRDLRMTRRAVQNFKAEYDGLCQAEGNASPAPQLALPF